MSQIFSQIDHDPDSFIFTGASSATSVQAARPLVVNYSNGSSDTIPINTVAVLSDGVTTTFDRSLSTWVIYTVPGSGLLYAVLESQMAGLTGDYAPLIRILRHDWQRYRPMQPSGAAIRAGAWSGGAFIAAGRALSGGGFYGAFDSQSLEGGGSVSGVPWYVNTGPGNNGGTVFGFFVKVASLPASDMALVDLDAGVSGYLRCKLTSAGHVFAETNVQSVSLSLDVSAGALTTATWYWVTVRNITNPGSNGVRLQGQVTVAGGSTPGTQTADSLTGPFYVTTQYAATLGWGVNHSASYLDFPNSTGHRLSKLELAHLPNGAGNPALLAVPSADVSASGLDALYLCRQAVGAVSTLTDSTTNTYDLTAGAQGMAIVSDGPYA